MAAGSAPPLAGGDSVEVGLSLGSLRVDGLMGGGGQSPPDIRVMLACAGGRPMVKRVWNGEGTELAVSIRPASGGGGVVRYEAAIPFRDRYRAAARRDVLGFALRINDADRGQATGSLCWEGPGGGLEDMGSSARFGSVVLARLSGQEVAQSRRLIDMLPDSALAWDRLREVVLTDLAFGDVPAAVEELAGFVRRHPGSFNVSKCLAWVSFLEGVGAPAVDGSATGKPASRSAELAATAGIPALEREEAGLRLFAQVQVRPDCRPRGLAFALEYKGAWGQPAARRGVYWGEAPRGCPLVGDEMVYAGPLPAGDRFELVVPAELLEAVNKPVTAVRFGALDSQAWWGDFGLIDGQGRRHVWIRGDEAPDPGRGSKAALPTPWLNWATGRSPAGQAAHFARSLGVEWTWHQAGIEGGLPFPAKLGGLNNANLALEQAGGTLPKDPAIRAAWADPAKRAAGDLLIAVGDRPEVARFVRKFPRGGQTGRLLDWLASNAAGRALADELIANAGIDREVSRAHYAAREPGIAEWQVVGPFSNEGDVALRRECGPERQVELSAAYTDGETELHWSAAKADLGRVDLAKLFGSGGYQAAYAAVWVRATEQRRAWVLLDSPNVVSLWNGSERVLENAEAPPRLAGGGRRARVKQWGGIEPAPITLAPGWNRLLVKDCGRFGYWGFKLRLGNADGSPLDGLEYSATPPGQ